MRRLLWLGLGLALGALVFRKATHIAERLTPKRLVSSATSALAELSEAIRDFAADVRDGMSEHESALREAAELDGGRLGAPPAPPVPPALAGPEPLGGSSTP